MAFLLPDNLANPLADLRNLLQSPEDSRLTAQQLQADVLRLDLLHPVISGNKWFKLKYHLSTAQTLQSSCLLTFGGAWSNHLVAAACAAQIAGIPSVGIIRGEKPPILSATLEAAAGFGMQLEFISRQDYTSKDQPSFLQTLSQRFPGAYIVPEGGGGEEGVRGSMDILSGLPSNPYTHILCAIGTGTTFLGLAAASLPHQHLIGIPVLKGMDSINAIHPDPYCNKEVLLRCSLFSHYHFGGYARHPDNLLTFMNDLYRQTGIPTDIVYTGKLFFAFYDLIQQHFFPAQSRILLIHSGGLQGNQSLPPGKLIF